SAQAQYQLADIYLNDVNNNTFSIKEFESLIDKYPNSEFAKRSIFMLGYINSNYTESYDDAIMYYNMFLENYPDDDLALSVNYELNLLDSSGTINALKKLRKNRKF
ncbi:MAG: tetratricopeptide repeat protein, partial [SAR202 cluster bacterium]|nr:tetratricopeptide repeat protein [SAR202 cluster bacterium]